MGISTLRPFFYFTKLYPKTAQTIDVCEDKAPSTMNIEHFHPHRGNRNLMFAWNNLFLACGHCNNVKGAKPIFDDILDCTDSTRTVVDLIKFFINPWPFEEVQITALTNNPTVNNTVVLLNQVYNGTTALKVMEGENIRSRLVDEMFKFTERVNSYFIDTNTDEQKKEIKDEIRRMLSVKSAFIAFKIWMIKSNARVEKEFKALIP